MILFAIFLRVFKSLEKKMPQELHVLRCYACKKFQVQIVKKVPKWQCKVCNEKQSILKVYAKGSGKDCRQYVQDLNMQQGVLMSEEPNEQSQGNYGCEMSRPNNFGPAIEQKTSKWSEYLENEVTENSCDQDFTGLRQEDVEDSQMSLRGNSGHVDKASKWSEYLGDEGLNYGNNCESSNLESLDAQAAQVSRGKKRKRSHLKHQVDEEYTGVQSIQSIQYQSKPEVDSGISSTSTTSHCMEVSQERKQEKNSLSCKTQAAGVKRNSSKWSQFLISEEEIIPSTAHEAFQHDVRKQQFLSNTSTSDILKQKPQARSVLNGEKLCQATSVQKHPFHITDDNLDTILDF